MKKEEVTRIGRSIIREADLKIPVTYNGETFTLKYPAPYQKALIESEIARRLGGFPRASYSPEHVMEVEACVTIDALYIQEECPTWFTGPWSCFDEELIGTLFSGYLSFRDKFREKLRAGGFKEDSPGDTS